MAPIVKAMTVVQQLAQGQTELRIFGLNPDVNADTEDVWEVGGVATLPGTAGVGMQFVSTDVQDGDTGGAGTGARTVLLTYLDADLAQQTEIVTLTGTDAAATAATDIRRVQKIVVASAGTVGAAAGTITLTGTAGSPTYGQISAGKAAALQALYTVPAGYEAHLVRWRLAAGGTSGEAATGMLCVSSAGNGLFVVKDVLVAVNAQASSEFYAPVIIAAGGDIAVRALSGTTAAGLIVAVSVEGWIQA